MFQKPFLIPVCARGWFSSRTESEFYNNGIFSFVIKPPLRWNDSLLLIYFPASIFAWLLAPSSLSLSLSVSCVRKKAPKSGGDFKPQKDTLFCLLFPLCSLSSLTSPYQQGCLALPSGTVATTNSPHSLHTTQLDHEAFLFSTALILRAIDVYISPHLSFSLSLHALLLK